MELPNPYEIMINMTRGVPMNRTKLESAMAAFVKNKKAKRLLLTILSCFYMVTTIENIPHHLKQFFHLLGIVVACDERL